MSAVQVSFFAEGVKLRFTRFGAIGCGWFKSVVLKRNLRAVLDHMSASRMYFLTASWLQSSPRASNSACTRGDPSVLRLA